MTMVILLKRMTLLKIFCGLLEITMRTRLSDGMCCAGRGQHSLKKDENETDACNR